MRVKGFKIFRDRHGKWRCYHRASRLPIDLTKNPLGSAEFVAECARIGSLLRGSRPGRPGTLGLLIQGYRGSPAFLDLAPRTRADYQRCFSYLEPIADTALTRFDRALVVRIRDKANDGHGRRFGNYVKSVLSIVFAWGADRGFVDANPAFKIKNIRRKKGLPNPNRPWNDSERHAVLDGMPPHMLPAVALMMFTGLGPKDALSLPRSFYKGGDIATHRSKTGEAIYWTAPSQLAEILTRAPSHNALTLCANARGLPWTESGFRASWRKVRLKLERAGKVGPSLTLYGLRHTVAVILRESGADERSIADALGQKTIEMARLYSKGADLKQKMKSLAESFDDEVNRRRTNSVKPAG